MQHLQILTATIHGVECTPSTNTVPTGHRATVPVTNGQTGVHRSAIQLPSCKRSGNPRTWEAESRRIRLRSKGGARRSVGRVSLCWPVGPCKERCHVKMLQSQVKWIFASFKPCDIVIQGHTLQYNLGRCSESAFGNTSPNVASFTSAFESPESNNRMLARTCCYPTLRLAWATKRAKSRHPFRTASRPRSSYISALFARLSSKPLLSSWVTPMKYSQVSMQ